MRVDFERQALYDEVWATDMFKLGPKYGVSEMRLRQICKEMDIPLPKRDYWARRDAGESVVQLPLPADAKVHTHTAWIQEERLAIHQRPEDQMWLTQKIEQERSFDWTLEYVATPKRWHRLLVPLRAELIETATKQKQWIAQRRKDATPPSRKPKSGEPVLLPEPLVLFPDSFLVSRYGPTCLRVSFVTLDRALAIANALLFAAEKRGFEVALDEAKARFVFNLDVASVKFAIRERQEQVIDKYGSRRPRPTDRLAWVVERPNVVGYKEILESKDASLETRLYEVFPVVYQFVVAARERARADAAAKTRNAEAQIRRDEEERKRKLIEAAIAVAKERKATLVQDVARWREAQQVREYIAAVVSRAEDASVSSEALIEWQIWALGAADEMDPIEERVHGLVKTQ
jgi:hypothetical protein